MANALYDPGKEGLLNGDFDLNTTEMRLVLIDENDDAPVLTTDNALDDITGAARVATSNALDGPTITSGVFDATDETLSAVTGDQAESITIYEHNGTESLAILLLNLDTGTNLPVTPNGGDIIVQWSSGGSKIFAI